MKIRVSPLAGVLVAGTLALTACGGAETGDTKAAGKASGASAPTPAQMLESAITKSTSQTSAAFALDASVVGQSDDPELKPFLQQPLKAGLSGAGSAKAVNLSGSVSVKGKPYEMAVRADQQRSFVQFMQTWYGPSDGITSTTEKSATDPAELKRALLKVRTYGNDVLTGKVGEGAEVDGQKTWEFNGTLNPDGIVKVAATEGRPLSGDDQAGLRAIAPLVKLRFAVGQTDGLFREIGVSFKLTQSQIKLLERGGSSGVSLKALAVDLTLELKDYGKAVTVQVPADPQPIKALGGALLGSLMALSG